MKRKRQGWSNCNILKQLHTTKDQEKLDGNTVDAVFRNPLAGGSHEISHTVPCGLCPLKKISTVLGRRLQNPQAIQGNQSSLLFATTSSLIKAKYLPWMVPDCAPY